MTEQSEWATDVLFGSAADLARLYPRLLRQCLEVLGCRDVLRFLGRKVPATGYGTCAGEVKGDLKERHEGLRAKFWYGGNSVKLYDKQAMALRLETTINQPSSFTVYRPKEGDEQGDKDWRPLRKGVADLHRRAEVSQRANDRLAESLASVADPRTLGELWAPLTRRVEWQGRGYRALNPLGSKDGSLLEVLGRGEYLLEGFRNRDVRVALYGVAADEPERRRQSAAVTRQLRLLRAHGLLVKVNQTHRYQLSAEGRRLLTALQTARAADVSKLAASA